MTSLILSIKDYLEPIIVACIMFPFVAFLFTIPFLVVNYRKYGGIALMRVVVVYSFILYMMCAFFLTVLPLPSRAEVAATPAHPILWIPFTDLMTGLRKAGLVSLAACKDFGIWKKFLLSKDLFQILANIVMQVPLGFYLRYYFKCNIKKTVLIGFLVSLFYETVQYTGLFFIYEHAYRFTSVDDLINNTLGALIGYVITPLIALILPSREEIDKISYSKANKLTLTRRLAALVIDLIICSGLAFLGTLDVVDRVIPSHMLARLAILVGPALYYSIVPLFTKGRTVGHALLKIKVVNAADGMAPRFHQLVLRYFNIYVAEPMALLVCMCLAFAAIGIVISDGLASMFSLVCFVACVVFILFFVWLFMSTLQANNCLPHSMISKTRVVLDEPEGRSFRS